MEKEVPELITVEAARDSHRWVAITALLLAIGVILHTISPNVGGVTPNWTIAMYSITTNLTHPGLLRVLGTGFVAGLTIVPSSKSAFPLGNIASEIAGSLTACLLVKAFVSLHLGKFRLVPLIIGFFATLVSGSVFTNILCIVLGLPFSTWLKVMLPVVLVVAVLNALITQVLYRPVEKVFHTTGGEDHE